jgi:formylglycine-generating enzyme
MKKLIVSLITITAVTIILLSKPAKTETDGFAPCPKDLSPGMACVPGGSFIMGSDSKKWKDENPAHTVIVSTFLIDKYEVTTEEYQKCAAEGRCTDARSNYRQMRGLKQPQIKVTWFQARDYCVSQGKRLPSEAEFEKASRGPNGNTYPWGNEMATCERAVIMEGEARGCTKKYKAQGITSEVGSKQPGVYGLYDMAGNAHEWVNDWYEKSYSKCGSDCLGRDPKGPCQGKDQCPGYTERVVKGGSWYWNWEWARASKRRAYIPKNNPPHHFGFRCARDVI